MRILVITHGLYPGNHGGVEMLGHWLGRALVRQSHAVTIAGPASERFCPAPDATYNTLPLPPARHGYFGDPPAAYQRAAWKVVAGRIRRERPDVIFAMSLVRLGWPWLAALDDVGVPFVAGVHDFWYLCPGIEYACGGSTYHCAMTCQPSRPAAPWTRARAVWAASRRKRRIVRLLNKLTAPLVAPSASTVNVFAANAVDRRRLVVIPNGIELADLADHRVQAVPSRLPPEVVRFGFLGRLAENKGVRVLARAFQCLDDRTPATLDVWGGGPLENDQALRAYACDERVHFHGAYCRSQLPDILDRVDVVVVPSTWEEPYGLVVQEAFAAGKIVIASCIGGLREQIVHGQNGLLAPPGEEAPLARLMRTTAEKLLRGQSPLRHMPQARSIEDVAGDYERVLEACVDNWNELKSGAAWPVDWQMPLDASSQMPRRKSLGGNVDPTLAAAKEAAVH